MVKNTEEKKECEKLALVIPDGADVENIRDILEAYPGDIPVLFAINGKAFDPQVSVRKCEGLKSELESVVGKDGIVFFIKKLEKQG